MAVNIDKKEVGNRNTDNAIYFNFSYAALKLLGKNLYNNSMILIDRYNTKKYNNLYTINLIVDKTILNTLANFFNPCPLYTSSFNKSLNIGNFLIKCILALIA